MTARIDATPGTSGVTVEPTRDGYGRRRAVLAIAARAVLAMNILLMLYYIGYGYRQDFHSDSAAKNLLAEEIARTGQLFPSEWNYVNGDLWTLFGHLFIVPLLAFFRNGYGLHAVSGAASAALILWGVWLVSGMATRDRLLRVFALALFAGGISFAVAENLYGQVSYGNVLIITCFTLYAVWRSLDEAAVPARKLAWLILASALTFASFLANPQRAIASYTAPLCFALVLHAAPDLLARRWTERARYSMVALGALALAALVGIVAHGWVLAGVNNAPGAGAARWLTFDQMTANVGNTLHGLIGIYGGVPTAADDVITGRGVYAALRMIAAIALLVVMPSVIRRSICGPTQATRFLASFVLASFVLFVFLQVTTTIPDMSDPVGSSRYLVPTVMLGTLLVLGTVGESGYPAWQRLAAGTALVLITLGSLAPGNPEARALSRNNGGEKVEMAKFLRDSHLKYGYATYWNAGVTTVLSSDRVKTRQIVIEQGLPMPMRHLSSDFWYSTEAWTGPTFLLLDETESKQIDWRRLARYAGEPVETLAHGKFKVYRFDKNLASVLPSWSDKVRVPLPLLLSEATSHNTGRFELAGDEGRMVAEQGEPGYLHFGPYLRVQPGRYIAVFDVEIDGVDGSEYGNVDVTTHQSSQVHATRPLNASGRQRLEVAFDLLEKADDLEMRVSTTGKARMILHGVELRPQLEHAQLQGQ